MVVMMSVTMMPPPPRSSLSIFQWLLTSENFLWNPISEKSNVFLEFDFWTFEHFPWNLTFLLLQPAADTSATGYGPPAEEYGAPSSSYGSAYSRSVRILCPMISSTLGFNYLYFITCSKLHLASSNKIQPKSCLSFCVAISFGYFFQIFCEFRLCYENGTKQASLPK